jgi:hypothetical protein
MHANERALFVFALAEISAAASKLNSITKSQIKVERAFLWERLFDAGPGYFKALLTNLFSV